jgi:putative AlgH/UPF0301 family transcriptional regulator
MEWTDGDLEKEIKENKYFLVQSDFTKDIAMSKLPSL